MWFLDRFAAAVFTADVFTADVCTSVANATYKGDAFGVYSSTTPGEFAADVTLETNFGTTPTISGSITNFLQVNSTKSRTTCQKIQDAPTTLTLSMTIPITNIGGRFTGTISDDGYTGNYGGVFYGAEATKIGGTFGASNTGGLSFLGSYIAQKEVKE